MTAATMAWRPVTGTGGVQYGLLVRPRRGRPRFSDDALLRKIAGIYNGASHFPRRAVWAWLTAEHGNGMPYPERSVNRLIRRAKDKGYAENR